MVKTAKVWVVLVRVLWLHSAAWMAVLVFAAEQFKVPGHFPLVFDVAGSRVAVTVAMARARDARENFILGACKEGLLGVEGSDVGRGEIGQAGLSIHSTSEYLLEREEEARL